MFETAAEISNSSNYPPEAEKSLNVTCPVQTINQVHKTCALDSVTIDQTKTTRSANVVTVCRDGPDDGVKDEPISPIVNYPAQRVTIFFINSNTLKSKGTSVGTQRLK